MSAAAYLVTIASLVLAVGCVFLMLVAYRETGELLSPWILFLGMSVVDFYLPAAMLFTVGLNIAPWVSPLATDSAMPSVLLFTAGVVCFALGYARADRHAPKYAALRRPSSTRLAAVALVIATIVFVNLAMNINAAGGIDEYLQPKLLNRFAAPVYQEGWASLFTSLGVALVPVLFVLAGVAFHDRVARPLLGVLVPLLAVAAAATMLLRGVFLTLLLGLAIVERSRLEDLARAGSREAVEQSRRINRRIIAICAVGIGVFLIYGTTRNYFTDDAAFGQATIGRAAGTEVSRIVRGEGFAGLMGVMHDYPARVPFFLGRTIRDMLLLPVPRAIWTEKPAWYGIDDITRAMGWPSSTMSAVTMQGELYANFAVWGVPLMWVYGWMFGRIRRYRFGPRFRYIYAFVIVPMMLSTFWMAFTGFVNQLTPIPLMSVALWFVFGGTEPRES